MAGPADLDQTLRTICVLALKLLPGAELAAVTRPGAPPVGTSELAEHLAELLAAHPEEVAAGHHVLTEPLPGADGELLLFTTSPHGFQDIDPAVLEMCATAAGAVATATGVIDQLDRALSTRAVIEQAKGILMATHRVGADAAFHMLVAKSQAVNKKLHLVAGEFVTNASRR